MNKSRKIANRLAWVLFIIYILLLSYFLFFSEGFGRVGGNSEYKSNLQLFKEIKRFITYRETIGFKGFFINVIGNVLAFIPFGLVLPFISPANRKLINISLLSFELTLCVEIVQYLLKVGIFDVDDILLNTIGGILGYLIFLICRWTYYKLCARRKPWRR